MKKNHKKYGIIYFMVVFFIVIIIRVFIYNYFDKNIADSDTRFIVSQIFRFFIWVVPAFIYLIFIDKVNPFEYLKLTTISKKGAVYCIAVLGAGVLWQIAEIKLLGDTIGKLTLLSVSGLIIIPLFEEILCRGFILNKLAELMGFGKALLVSAGFFLLCHLPGWFLIEPVMPIKQILMNSFSVFAVVGLLSGLLMKKSNSLYPSFLLHTISNFISSI